MGKIILTLGLIGLCHAAYSATQHKSYMRLTEHDMESGSSFSSLPLDIIVQTVVCLFLSCLGVIQVSAKFKPIKITSEWENKTWDNVANRSSFYSFNHRGKFLFSDAESENQRLLANYVNIARAENISKTENFSSESESMSSDEKSE